jgi:hypothetical protein
VRVSIDKRAVMEQKTLNVSIRISGDNITELSNLILIHLERKLSTFSAEF